MENCEIPSPSVANILISILNHSVGYDNSIVLKQPGKEFREMRKALSFGIGKSAAASRDRLIRRQDLSLYLKNIRETPDLLWEHSRWYVLPRRVALRCIEVNI